MLVLSNISKVYGENENAVKALQNVSIKFRQKEFVSILGPSGCGKTTLLNIIGGLDSATDGDLLLNGASTKNFTEADWDDYRNASVGFVFQNYNLISHLDILSNVELALTVSGASGAERTQKAKAALDAVGLNGLYRKRPNQLSGGQAQRVAIARAIVNDPDLLLADEPTGAIDSETSIQVMDLLKEISKNRLVIMVTHNGELAEKYSTRIVRVLDGRIISDTDHYEDEPIKVEEGAESEAKEDGGANVVGSIDSPAASDEARDKNKKPRRQKANKRSGNVKRATNMSFLSAVKLSWNNLYSKRGRSVLTAIAGSIGIICIALILAVNNGFSKYIAEFEKNSLSRYPITVTTGEDTMMNMLERLQDQLMGAGSSDSFNPFGVLTGDRDGGKLEKFPAEELTHIYELFTGMLNSFQNEKSRDISVFKKYLESGAFDYKWGSVKYDYSIDMSIYSKTEDENGVAMFSQINPLSQSDTLVPLIEGAFDNFGEDLEAQKSAVRQFLDTFDFWDELVGDNSAILTEYDVLKGHLPQDKTEIALVLDEYNQISDFDAFALNELGLGDIVSLMLTPDRISEFDETFDEAMAREFYVLPTEYQFVKNDDTGLYYDVKERGGAALKDALENHALKLKISCILRPKADVTDGCINGVIGYPSSLSQYIIDNANNSPFVVESNARYNDYLDKLAALNTVMEKVAELNLRPYEYFTTDKLTDEEKQILTSAASIRLTSLLTGEDISVDEHLTLMGDINSRDLDKPSFIYIYPNSVRNKDKITDFINAFNADRIREEAEIDNQREIDGEEPITYTDIVEYTDDLDAIVHDLDSMVDTITYILIAVALVSVLVTMLLIAIVMYISVQDRTREIGILRAIGARKTDISNIFNAETIMLGCISGVVGSLLAFVLQYPANAIFNATLGLSVAQMTWWHPIVLIIGSILLTLIAGLIPAIIAAKKQPVIALRTE